MSLRTIAAVTAGKLAGAASRRFGQGGGSALPGLVAEAVDGHIVRHLAAQIPLGSILVTGTNGKTTTAHMIATILQEMQWAALHNRTGSNLMRGLATTLVSTAEMGGSLPNVSDTVGLFEVDEFVLLQAVQEVRPRIVLMTNLFRDQLDRYGEVDLIGARWQKALRALPAQSTAVLNADDPMVGSLEKEGSVLYYGIDDPIPGSDALEHAADSKWCPRCEVPFIYSLSYYGHLGHYACPQCGLHRPEPTVRARRVDLHGFDGTDVELELPDTTLSVRLGLPGLYNVYNALAATAVAVALGVPAPIVKTALEKVTAAFGRMERLSIDGKTVYLLLAKNPTGLNQVVRTLLTDPDPKHLAFLLNDNIADGRDVSWIWDVDFERLQGQVRTLVCGGIRAEDMALRFKLAGVWGAPVPQAVAAGEDTASSSPPGMYVSAGPAVLEAVIEKEPGRAMDQALAQVEPGGTLYVVPTYTAMLDLRRELARRGHVSHFLENA